MTAETPFFFPRIDAYLPIALLSFHTGARRFTGESKKLILPSVFLRASV